jgi:alanine-synthesizing transaminase
VQTALGGVQSIYELTSESGRLGRQRRAALRAIEKSKYLRCVTPRGAMYAFPEVHNVPGFDDQRFAMELLEREHVLVVPGSSFNVPYRNHFRITLLPDEETMTEVFVRIERQLDRAARIG